MLASLKGNSLTKYYGTSNKYSAIFWKDNAVLANTKVSLKINGKTYYVKTNSKGVATLDINLLPGKYVMTATNLHSGEKIYNNVVVKKDSSKINAKAKTYIALYNAIYQANHDILTLSFMLIIIPSITKGNKAWSITTCTPIFQATAPQILTV